MSPAAFGVTFRGHSDETSKGSKYCWGPNSSGGRSGGSVSTRGPVDA